jgi:hypothetical protein
LPNTTVPGVTMASTVLPSSPVTAAESPRNGTCKTLIPVVEANSSMPMCCPVPTPAVPMVNVPGFAFAASTKSLMVLYGESAWVTMKNGTLVTDEMNAKSLIES